MKSISDIYVLNNGNTMPVLGLGVYRSANGGEVESAIHTALECGYRLIDTASIYGNEEGVGLAINSSGLEREEIFVTTKVWNSDHGYESTLKAFDMSLTKLNLNYIDMYLVHWPVSGKYTETWRALEKLYADGVVKNIGVSNFMTSHLNQLLQNSDIVPAVNQVEFHPLLTQPELMAFCKEKNIQPQAWSPLIKGRVMQIDTLKQIGEKYGKSPAQVTLRWSVQKCVATIPKSSNPDRIKQNADIFDFNLSDAEIQSIDALNKNERLGPHPDGIDF